MFIDIGEGWQVNLALVAKIHVVDMGGSGTVFKFYSPSNDHLGDFNASTPEDMKRVLDLVRSYGAMATGVRT
jgi:hypothetical protein